MLIEPAHHGYHRSLRLRGHQQTPSWVNTTPCPGFAPTVHLGKLVGVQRSKEHLTGICLTSADNRTERNQSLRANVVSPSYLMLLEMTRLLTGPLPLWIWWIKYSRQAGRVPTPWLAENDLY